MTLNFSLYQVLPGGYTSVAWWIRACCASSLALQLSVTTTSTLISIQRSLSVKLVEVH
jgi:hypothetical protein